MSKARRVFTAKKIPDSWRRQEELKRAAGRASTAAHSPWPEERAARGLAHATHLQTTEARKYSENHLWHLKAFVCCDLWPLCGLSQVGFWSVSEKMMGSSETCTEKSRFRPMFLARKSFLSANCHELVCRSFIRCKCKSPCWGLNMEPRIAQYVFFFQRKQNISKTAAAWKVTVVAHGCCVSVRGSYVSPFPPLLAMKGKGTACMAHYFCSHYSSLRQSSKMSRNWMTGWKCKGKDSFSGKGFTCQIRERSLSSVMNSSFTSVFYFFHFLLVTSPLLCIVLETLNKQSKHLAAGWKRRSRHNLTAMNKAWAR